jgi:hypothetical protein
LRSYFQTGIQQWKARKDLNSEVIQWQFYPYPLGQINSDIQPRIIWERESIFFNCCAG